jgi:hypothetical protein
LADLTGRSGRARSSWPSQPGQDDGGGLMRSDKRARLALSYAVDGGEPGAARLVALVGPQALGEDQRGGAG